VVVVIGVGSGVEHADNVTANGRSTSAATGLISPILHAICAAGLSSRAPQRLQ
jgi:hypothetical protein